jgi:hypothetical protein
MTDNPVLRIFDADAFAGCRDGDAATEPVPRQEIDVAALRRRADSRSPEEVAKIVEEIDRATLAQDALDLARSYLDLADLEAACRWLVVAVAYGAPDAEKEFADVVALRDAVGSIPTMDMEEAVIADERRENTGVTAVAQARMILGNAVGVLRDARRTAGRTVDDAERKAERISSAAGLGALLSISCLGGGQAVAAEGESSAALHPLMGDLGAGRSQDTAEVASFEALLQSWAAWLSRTDTTEGSAVLPDDGRTDSATRKAVKEWARTCGELAGVHFPAEAKEHERCGQEGRKVSPNHPPDLMSNPLSFPSALPSPLRSTEPVRLVNPLWFPPGVSYLPPVRERITPGPRLRSALNRISTSASPSDVPLEAAG